MAGWLVLPDCLRSWPSCSDLLPAFASTGSYRYLPACGQGWPGSGASRDCPSLSATATTPSMGPIYQVPRRRRVGRSSVLAICPSTLGPGPRYIERRRAGRSECQQSLLLFEPSTLGRRAARAHAAPRSTWSGEKAKGQAKPRCASDAVVARDPWCARIVSSRSRLAAPLRPHRGCQAGHRLSGAAAAAWASNSRYCIGPNPQSVGRSGRRLASHAEEPGPDEGSPGYRTKAQGRPRLHRLRSRSRPWGELTGDFSHAPSPRSMVPTACLIAPWRAVLM
ncbi:uncharacterized protein PSFLO_02790 [Pseudozyma flocculosa]|uniref:Uncharacterized protein n=1 Tax=Pseudozyma flocculosa TaxID=84751 RepID=A0A5C3F0T9_9BASI|nr:uncharacterized protein PSFLO_02790 [Pseudozyma flocculosa]